MNKKQTCGAGRLPSMCAGTAAEAVAAVKRTGACLSPASAASFRPGCTLASTCRRPWCRWGGCGGSRSASRSSAPGRQSAAGHGRMQKAGQQRGESLVPGRASRHACRIPRAVPRQPGLSWWPNRSLQAQRPGACCAPCCPRQGQQSCQTAQASLHQRRQVAGVAIGAQFTQQAGGHWSNSAPPQPSQHCVPLQKLIRQGLQGSAPAPASRVSWQVVSTSGVGATAGASMP